MAVMHAYETRITGNIKNCRSRGWSWPAAKPCCLRANAIVRQRKSRVGMLVSVAGTNPSSTHKEPRTSDSPAQAASCDSFDWAKQWYAMAVAEDLDPGRPHSVELLGQPLVLWRDGEGDWRAFEDRCPHRLAPLSEGRVEGDGTLLCSYHGWRFNGQGKCTAVPQANDEKVEHTACASQRSFAKSFPVKVCEDMLWVWGESGPAAFIDSAAKTPATTMELDALPGGTHINKSKPYIRDLHYDYATLVENFLDPAHVPFAHHGVLGNRYLPGAGSLQIQRSGPEHTVPNGGFSFDLKLKFDGTNVSTTRVQYQPPSLVRYFTPQRDFMCMNVHCVPCGPKRCRVTYTLISATQSKSTRKIGQRSVVSDHQQRHLVFDGDHALLHLQERTAEREAAQPGGSWRKSYYMPTDSDRVVTAWRQWLDQHGAPAWAPGAPPPPPQPLSKAVLLDRYEQHTKHCPTCLQALFWFRAGRAAAAAVSIAAAAAALAAALSRPLVTQWQLPAALSAVAVLAAWAWRFCNSWVPKFLYVEYDHQAKE